MIIMRQTARILFLAAPLLAACAGSPRVSTPAAVPGAPTAPAGTATTTSPAASPAAASPLALALDSIGRQFFATAGVPSVSIAVYRGGEPVLVRAYGAANTGTGAQAGPETVYRIGSVTKQFTAAAILRLVEHGKLSLDDEITKYLPDYPTRGNRVTIHHLLNHTSGIKSYTELGAKWASRWSDDLTHEQMLALFRDEPFDFTPGERWKYNNSGYYLLGMVIETVTGRPYAGYLESEFFRPLGLRHTSYCPNQPAAGHAEGYQVGSGGTTPAPALSMTHPYAAGALCSTAEDLARWTDALTEGRAVSPESFRRMTAATVLPSGTDTGYGYGLARGKLENAQRIAHGGGIHGFVSYLSHYPEQDVTIAVLTNSTGTNPQKLEETLARRVLGIPEPAVEDRPLAAAERARYVGTYDLGRLQIRVFEEGEKLVAQATNQPATRLLHQGSDEFRPEVDPAIRIVFRVSGERAEGLDLHQAGQVVPARRVD